jgi:putative transposase
VGGRVLATSIPDPVPEALGRVLRLRMRDELLAVEQFDSLLEAKVLVTDRKEKYNTCRTHSALGMLTPVEFSEAVVATNQLQLT